MARVVCFGELLVRLSAPPGEVLLQSPRLDLNVGGAEANVAVSLARLGCDASFVSVIPDNALGRTAVGRVLAEGVDVGAVSTGPGRMGLYFLTPGAGVRASEVLYDRAGSAFAIAEPGAFDWPALLEGAAWLHLSGVTPALGERGAASALAAARAARAAGVKVAFDGNYRSALWAAWDGDGPAILRGIIAEADLAFVDRRDIALVLGRSDLADDDAAAMAAFAAFPNLAEIAATTRLTHDAGRNDLSARWRTRDGETAEAGPYALTGIVDRIGAGDAFAAGVLFAKLRGLEREEGVAFALAAAALKHAISGDFNLASEADVRAVMAGRLDVRR